jgi:Ser/Thr protein kinase RdoA (MazF antagonist)
MIIPMKIASDKQVGQALTKYFNKPVIKSLKLLTQGGENTSVLVDLGTEQIVLRFWGTTHSSVGERRESDMLGELGLMKHFHDNGLPVPKIYISRNGNLYEKIVEGVPYMVMAHVAGNTPHDFTANMVGQVAKAMGRMHTLSPDFNYPHERPWPGSVIDIAVERSKRCLTLHKNDDDADSRITQAVMRTFLDTVSETDLTGLPRGAIHGDIMFENIKFNDGELAGIFDFDDYRYSFFLEDIAKSLIFEFESAHDSMFGEDGSNVAAFLKAYETERKLSEREKALLSLFFTARFLYKLTDYSQKFDTGDAKYRPLVENNIRRFMQHQKYFISVKVG